MELGVLGPFVASLEASPLERPAVEWRRATVAQPHPAVLLLLSAPWWVPTGAGGVGVAAAGLVWFRRWRRRRSLPWT